MTGEDLGKVLKDFGDRQREALTAMANVVKDENQTSHTQLHEFRQEVTDRLDAVRKASTELLANANTVFAGIQSAIGEAEQKTTTALADQHRLVVDFR